MYIKQQKSMFNIVLQDLFYRLFYSTVGTVKCIISIAECQQYHVNGRLHRYAMDQIVHFL